MLFVLFWQLARFLVWKEEGIESNNPCTAIPGSIMIIAYDVMPSEDNQTST